MASPLPNLAPLAGQWDTDQERVPCPLGVLTPLCGPDPSRWSLMFGSSDGNPVLVGTQGQTALVQGFLLPATGLEKFSYNRDGAWVQKAWFGVATTANAIVTVWTARIVPPQ